MRSCFWQDYNADWIGARQAGRKYETAPNAPAKGFIIIIELGVIWCAPVLVSGLLLLLSKGHQKAKTGWIIMVVSFVGGMQCRWWHCPIDCMFITVSQLKPRRVCGGGVHWHNGFSIKNRFITRILVFWASHCASASTEWVSGPWKLLFDSAISHSHSGSTFRRVVLCCRRRNNVEKD